VNQSVTGLLLFYCLLEVKIWEAMLQLRSRVSINPKFVRSSPFQLLSNLASLFCLNVLVEAIIHLRAILLIEVLSQVRLMTARGAY